jgi:hypothetical protein
MTVSLFNLGVQQRRLATADARLCAPHGARAAVQASLGTNRITEAREAGNLLSTRAVRYRMQRTAQRLLQGEAVAGCHRNASARAGSGVKIVRHAETGHVSYKNLFACGSVWHCPVCAARIAECRRSELQGVICVHCAAGGSVVMMTLTFPHDRSMPLSELLVQQSEARRWFKGHSLYRRLTGSIGWLGTVCALEVTHGENGWHPHTHELLFVRVSEGVATAALEELRDLWNKAVVRAGLGQTNSHGFKVNGAARAAEYVAKFGDSESGNWNVTHEMTRAHSKQGRAKGRTPFALLHDAMRGDTQAGALFLEYAEEFKGKRQLLYSRGLKAKLGVDDVTDEEIVIEERADDEIVWTLDDNDWGLVYRANVRGELLDIADRHGADGCFEFMAALRLRLQGSGPYPGAKQKEKHHASNV